MLEEPRIDGVNNTVLCLQISINSAKSEDQLLCRGRPLSVDLTKVNELEFLKKCWGSGSTCFWMDPGPDLSPFLIKRTEIMLAK
jgi:hypothetical protein